MVRPPPSGGVYCWRRTRTRDRDRGTTGEWDGRKAFPDIQPRNLPTFRCPGDSAACRTRGTYPAATRADSPDPVAQQQLTQPADAEGIPGRRPCGTHRTHSQGRERGRTEESGRCVTPPAFQPRDIPFGHCSDDGAGVRNSGTCPWFTLPSDPSLGLDSPTYEVDKRFASAIRPTKRFPPTLQDQ